ncbi:O-methyltransferase [Ferruginibacter sp. HRS2-29]|uniref:O-methyltransferase n=1 Tax=Ferruginibacter sp. HRS2-29 TaxID=2487334 RepID=UPI0020CF283A|nr:class I SAM-dependent methyltransferase [Ferruginibacter sp. HRS2-29]MCP9753223.1 class I SAM-dependent methyltransferase [Ferruginibacter sp. HRS2-29]
MYSAFQLAKKYIRYYLTASNGKGHGVHSPFVFEFIRDVLNDKKQPSFYKSIEAKRKSLLSDNSTIEVEDFGAGSAVIKTNTRVVGKIAASSLKPRKYAQLLSKMVSYYQPLTIVELGTSFGITTAYLTKGSDPNASVFTFEGAPAIARIAQQNFDELGLRNSKLVQGDFAATFPAFLQETKRIDFAFVDGNHRKKPTLDYFYQLLQHVDPAGSILVFDDIHWSSEMEEAWEEIKKHGSVNLSIDLFFVGIIFLRKDFKVEQHFSIRF